MTTREYLEFFSQSVDLLATGDAQNGFTPNLNVLKSEENTGTTGLKYDLQQQGAIVTSTSEVSTPAGNSYTAIYNLTVDGKTIHGFAISVPANGDRALITISSLDEELTARVGNMVQVSVRSV